MSTPRDLELIRPLGQGGFGVVWLAKLTGRDGFSRRVAVKVMRDAAKAPPEIVRRQRDEARLLGLLQHPNIVQVLDLTEVEGSPAVVMEHIDGVDLAWALRATGPLPLGAAVEAIAAAASALDAAWSHVQPETGRPLRVIHRDIKPANLLVDAHGTLKVLDFGVARADFDREGRTQSMAFGTPRFMAPEQFLTGEVSAANDVYALGVSLFELVTGRMWERPPFADEPFEAFVQVQLGGVAEPLRAAMWPMLRHDPANRPSAGEVVHRLEGLQLGSAELRRWARVAVPEAARLHAVEQAERARRAAEEALQSPGASGVTDLDAEGLLDPVSTPGAPSHAGASASLGAVEPSTTPGRTPAELTFGASVARPASPVDDSGVSIAAPLASPVRTRWLPGFAAALAGLMIVAGLSTAVGGGVWAVWGGASTASEADAPAGEAVPLAEGAEPAGAEDASASAGEAASGDDPSTGTAIPATAVPSTAGSSRGATAAHTAGPTAPVRIAASPTSASTAVANTDAASPGAADSPEEAPTNAATEAGSSDPVRAAPDASGTGASPPDAVVPASSATPNAGNSTSVPAAPTRDIRVKSKTAGVAIAIDGRSVGATPVRSVPLALGSHSIQATYQGHTSARTIEVTTTSPTVLVYEIDTERFVWE